LENMKIGKALIVMTVLMLSSMFAFSIVFLPAIAPANAIKVTTTNSLVYADGTGANLASLATYPQFLIVHTNTPFATTTTVEVDGLDENGQNIEAQVFIPAGTGPEALFLLNDTVDNQPVAFASVTNIMQQGGTYGDQFDIYTQPAPIVALGQNSYQFYLGEYHKSLGTLGWQPGWCTPSFPYLGFPWPTANEYLWSNGPGNTPSVVYGYPPQPPTPSPLIVWLNWKDNNHDLVVNNVGSGLPNSDTVQPSSAAATLYIEGLDEAGNKLIGTAYIPAGATSATVTTPSGATFSEVDNVYGGGSDSYYIFTNPQPSIDLLTYTILIDHLQIYPLSYDILASGTTVYKSETSAEFESGPDGSTWVLVFFTDADGNLVYTSDTLQSNVTLSYYTSGGYIEPSSQRLDLNTPWNIIDAIIPTIYADTNAKTIKIVADAIIPSIAQPTSQPNLNLRGWTMMTEDGVNSAFWTAWPVTQLMWGYNDTANPAGVTLPVTPKPAWQAFVEEISGIGSVVFGGTTIENMPAKFDGPIYEISIPISPGCNLISSPVHPILNAWITGYPLGLSYGSSYYGSVGYYENTGIPMYELFGWTDSANIELIWWYTTTERSTAGVTGTSANPANTAYTSQWNVYIPSTNVYMYGNATYTSGITYGSSAGPYFTDGVGYWVKADKSCTIEFSGVSMENAPFTPTVYTLAPFRYNLIGFTSVVQLSTASYLEGLASVGYLDNPSNQGGYTAASGAIGVKAPVWTWNAAAQTWSRDPTTLWPTQGFWIYTSANQLAP